MDKEQKNALKSMVRNALTMLLEKQGEGVTLKSTAGDVHGEWEPGADPPSIDISVTPK